MISDVVLTPGERRRSITFGKIEMNGLPKDWHPLALEDLREELAGFEDWVLCGGHSVALAVGKDSRTHGDIDVGVFRSQVVECLRTLDGARIFLCRQGTHEKWNGETVPHEVHDIWISSRDGKSWAFQIMVFDDEGDEVVYRRDPRLKWPKHAHSHQVGGTPILNPLVTLLFKAHRRELQEKDAHDLRQLISNWPNKAPQPASGSVTRRAPDLPNPNPHGLGTPRASSLRG